MQEVTMENLIQGKEYWMEGFTLDYERRLVSHYKPYKMIAKFQKIVVRGDYNSTYAEFTNFRQIKYKDNKDDGYNVSLNDYYWKFYEIIREKVHHDMESRALKKILTNIIKDEYYTYTY